MEKQKPQKVATSFFTDKVIPFFSSVGSLLFIVLGTILIIYYIQGYRLTIDGKVEKTGVLMVTTNPLLTNILLNGDNIGRAPKTVTSLKVGKHTVEILRNGYFDWKKEILISEGRTTPINALLFKNNVKGNAQLKINENIFFSQSDSQNKSIFIATELQVGGNKAVKILRYSTNLQFWQNNNNPIVIFDELINSETTPTITLSPEGKTLLMNFDGILIDRESPALQNEQLTNRFLYITTNQTSTQPKVIDNDIHENRNLSFINENELLLLTETTIEKLDLRTQEVVTLREELSADLIWDIDQDGIFYYIENLTPTSADKPLPTTVDSQESETNLGILPSRFQIMQIAENSDEPKVIIDESDLLNLDEERFDNTVLKFKVVNDSKNIVLTANGQTIFVDIASKKYIEIASEPMNFVAVSPDDEKALFYNEDKVALLTFDKENADHVTTIGSVEFRLKPKIVTSLYKDSVAQPQLLSWHTSSEAFLVADENNIYVSDLDGQNLYKLVLCSGFCTASEDGDSVYVLDRELSGATTSLIRYNIR